MADLEQTFGLKPRASSTHLSVAWTESKKFGLIISVVSSEKPPSNSPRHHKPLSN